MFKSLFNLFIKHQDSNPENPNNPSTPASSNNIFKSVFNLFIKHKDSIFSDSNPFRTTKPVKESQQKQLQEILHLDIDSPQNNDTQIPKFADNKLLSKRKRKEKIPTKDFGSDGSDIETEVKKLKIEDGFVLESDKVVNFDEKKKKKRKRGEVEAEYEERKYGGVDLENKEVEEGKRKIGVKRKEVELKGVELLVAKEGFDDEAKLLRTVFVGNLPLKVKNKKAALMREFSQFGEIESIQIWSIPLLDDKTRKGAIIKNQLNDAVDRVNAYIVFKIEDSAQASLSHNMAVVDGNHIHVDRTCSPRKKLKGENAPLYDSKRTVFIGNLPFDVKVEPIHATSFLQASAC